MYGSLTWRPLTSEDAQTSADLLNAIETVDQIGEHYLAEDTLTELIDPYADLERGSLAAFDGDVMVGYMKVRYKPSAEVEHRVVLDGGVHPGYRRQGLGTRLVKAGIAAAKELHALHHPALKLVVDVHKAERIAGIPELLRSQGFEPVRYFQRMERPLGAESAPIPDGLTIEAWSEENDDEFRVVRNESYADHWGVVPMPKDQWQNKITNQTFRQETSFLAREGEVAVGALVTMTWEGDFEATGIKDAHFMVIGTVPQHRKKGVASALIAHALKTAAQQGYHQASVAVDSASPQGAPGVLEKAGFTAGMRYVRWALEV